MKPVAVSRVSNPFAAPGSYASRADAHGRAGHHTGTDYGSAWPVPIAGREVRAILPGLVVISEFNNTMGNWVGIYTADSDLLVTYWHLASRRVETGRWVQVYRPLGNVGTTGNSTAPHLHLQVNRGRSFDYHAHANPTLATTIWTRRKARKAYKREPRHPQEV